jgi:hypothetical protein
MNFYWALYDSRAGDRELKNHARTLYYMTAILYSNKSTINVLCH